MTATPLTQTYPWLQNTPICDGLLPWSSSYLPADADFGTQLARFQKSGFSHLSLTLAGGQETAEDALARLSPIAAECRRSGIIVAHTEKAIRETFEKKQLSISFHFQTSTPFARSLDMVDAFFVAGVQRAILAYNDANLFADGCHEPRNAGLSSRGRELVKRMDQVGMRVDLTHCGVKTVFDVLEMDLKHPPLFSHSNVRSLFDHERNLSDEQIHAAAEAGCYIGLNGVGMFLGADAVQIPDSMARHAAYLAEMIGVDHIGLGLDFMYLDGSDYSFFHQNRLSWPRGYPEPPWDFFQPEQLPDLVTALLKIGFTKEDIRGILSENYLKHALSEKDIL